MKKNILLPTDFSNNSLNAIDYALNLYVNEECTFYLLNSIKMEAATPPSFSNKLSRVIHAKAKEEILELKERVELKNSNANHDFKTLLSLEDLGNSIDTAIKKHQINLVVMGTKGATGAKEFFFGSNTVRIIKQVKMCPVLVVPNDYDFVRPKEIAFPTDFNHAYNFLVLQPLKELATLFDSKIRIFHINEENQLNEFQEHNLNALKKYLKNYEHDFNWTKNTTKKVEEINTFVEEFGINILAMVNYKYSFIESVLKEPIIKKIGFHPIIPFFVIPE